MELFRALFRENRLHVLSGVVLVIASALANIGTINFVNRTIASEGQYLLNNPYWLLVLLLAAFSFGVGSQMIMTQLGYRVIYQLRGRLLQQVLNTGYEHLQSLGANRIYAAITKDIRSLQTGFSTLPFFLYAATMAAGGIVYLFALHWQMASVVMVTLLLAMGLAKFFTHKFQAFIRQDRELEDQLFASYSEILDGHKELLLNEPRGQAMLQQIMTGPALQSMHLLTKGHGYMVLNIHVMTTLILIQIAMVFWFVYTLNWGGLALATSFSLTLLFIRQPMNMAMGQLGPIFSARVSLKKLQSLNLESPDQQAPIEDPLRWSKLELKNAAYQYEGDESGFRLGPLSLEVNAGELLFLAGHNGAGKTTLIRMLLGLIQPREGQLLVDGKPLPGEKLRAYRHSFSAVLADFHLFENTSAIEGADREQITDWIEKLQLQGKVSVDQGKFTTTDLSTGQRKRLAMVSAIMEKRRVMVLDEWAADQDPVFRKKFYFELLPALKKQGYTLLVVSHDDRYFDVADRVLYLDNGQISEHSPTAGELKMA